MAACKKVPTYVCPEIKRITPNQNCFSEQCKNEKAQVAKRMDENNGGKKMCNEVKHDGKMHNKEMHNEKMHTKKCPTKMSDEKIA